MFVSHFSFASRKICPAHAPIQRYLVEKLSKMQPTFFLRLSLPCRVVSTIAILVKLETLVTTWNAGKKYLEYCAVNYQPDRLVQWAAHVFSNNSTKRKFKFWSRFLTVESLLDFRTKKS